MTMAGLEQRVEMDGLTVEFEAGSHAEVDERLDLLEEKVSALDDQISQLTSEADGLDYAVAVAGGVLAGMLDSLWVGTLDLSLGDANVRGGELVNRSVMQVARKNGYKGDDLAGAIRTLEQTFPFAGDKATNLFGGGRLHHLRDLSHHPTPVGLIASIVMQFTGQAWGVTSGGSLNSVNVASSGLIGQTVPEKLLFGTVKWLLHLISDVAGSSSMAGAGTGLPGPFLAMLHEGSAVWGKLIGREHQDDFMKWVESAFRGGRTGVKADFRTELGILEQLAKGLGRQALPNLLNEGLVRGFYFIRRALAVIRDAEPKTFSDLILVDLEQALPWRNPTITRMLTIATSTFTAIDLGDAAVRAAISTGGSPAFWVPFVLRVNFVGVARTTVAIGVDVRRGTKRSRHRNERVELMNERIHLLNARASYKVGDAWIAAEDASHAVELAGKAVSEAGEDFQTFWADTRDEVASAEPSIGEIRERDPRLLEELSKTMVWGRD